MFLGLTLEQWINLGLSLAIIILALALSRRIVQFVLNRGIRRLTQRTDTALDDTIIEALRPALVWLLVVFALESSVNRLDFLPREWADAQVDIFYVLYLMVTMTFVWRLTSSLFIWYGREVAVRTKTDLDEKLMPFFRRIALIILAALGLIVLLGHFEIDVNAFVTTLGIGSLAIALAAQAALEDTISGFLIMIDQPFRIGDRIEIEALSTWGDVVDIGLRSARIRTRDNRMVIIPNSVIGKSRIINHSYPNTRYRIQTEIGVAYGSDLEHVRQTLIEAVRGVSGVLPDKKVEALFLVFGDSALIFRVRWWINSYVDTRRMFDKVNTVMYNALNKAGIEMPNPQRDIYHKIAPQDMENIIEVLRGE